MIRVVAEATCDHENCGRTCTITLFITDTYDLVGDVEVHHPEIVVAGCPDGWIFGPVEDAGPTERYRGRPLRATCPGCLAAVREKWAEFVNK
jgi:hypothetical protein